MAVILPGKTACALTKKMLQDGDYVVCFSHFIHERDDPLWIYSDNCMLRGAFDAWEHREEFLARWANFERNRLSGSWRMVVDCENYLIKWGEAAERIVLLFLKYGFVINFRKRDWPSVRKAFLDTRLGEATCEVSDGTVELKMMGEKVQITQVIRMPELSLYDRILISSVESSSLTDSFRKLDRFFGNLSGN